MAELTVVGFKKDMYRASEVLNDLQQLNDDWVVDLHDAVAVYRDYGGKLRVDQSYQMTTGEGAGWGALWGLMIGSILAIPFTAGVSAAAAGTAVATGAIGGTAIGAGLGAVDASSWKDEFGIPDDFVQRVGALVQLGDSAIFAILQGNQARRSVSLHPEDRTGLDFRRQESAGTVSVQPHHDAI